MRRKRAFCRVEALKRDTFVVSEIADGNCYFVCAKPQLPRIWLRQAFWRTRPVNYTEYMRASKLLTSVQVRVHMT